MARRAKAQLGYEIYASDRTKAGLASVNRGFSGLTSSISKEAGMASQAVSAGIMGNASLMAATVGSTILSMAATSIQAFAAMEYKAAELFTLMRTESQKTKDAVLADLEAISNRTGQPINITLDVAYQLASGGVTAEDIPGMTEIVARGAAAGRARGQDEAVATLLITTMRAFNKEGPEASRTMDTLVQTVAKGQTDLGQLSTVMGRLNGVTSSLNMSLDTSSSSLSFLTTKTGNTSESVTQLVAMFTELGREEGKAGKFFKETAGVTFPEYIAATDDLGGALQILREGTVAQNKSMMDVFGSAEAARAADQLSTIEYRAFYKDFTKDIEGTTDDMYANIESTTQIRLDKAGSLWSRMWRGIGSEFASIWADITLQGEGEYQRRHRLEREAEEQHERNILAAISQYAYLRLEAIKTASRNELSTWGRHYAAIAQMDWAVAQQRLANLQARSRVTPQVNNPILQLATGSVTPPPQIDFDYTYNTPLDPNFGLDGAGGGGGKLDKIDRNITGLRDDLKSGQALTVTLDAMIDEGIILRTDTVERASSQIAARFGNRPVNRVRSG